MTNLTVAYITARKNPRLEWFLDSLAKQINDTEPPQVQLITPHAKDVHAQTLNSELPIRTAFPKPSVWSGPHRLTTKDYFSAANARNTAAALCATEWLAYVDDLSVLGPRWLEGVRDAIAGEYVGLGCYRKVHNLIVKDGEPVHYNVHDLGTDSRLHQLGDTAERVSARGAWMFGCSLVLRLEWLLEINGWPENLCDSLGGEDYLTGIVLQNRGREFQYDRRIYTIESEEAHGEEAPMVRWDPGQSPHDMSHAALQTATTSGHFDNDFGDGMNLRQLRASVLAGNPFPIRQNPQHHWFTKQPLSEL